MNPHVGVLLSTLMFSTAMSAWKIPGPVWAWIFGITVAYGLFLSLFTKE